jgi:hypothetical protein
MSRSPHSDETPRRSQWVVVLVLVIRLIAFISVLAFAGCLLYAGIGATVTTGCVAAITIAASTAAARLTIGNGDSIDGVEGPQPLAV